MKASNSLDGLDWADAAWAATTIALDFEESKIKREPKGEGGGQFASKPGGAAPAPASKAPAAAPKTGAHKAWETRRAKRLAEAGAPAAKTAAPAKATAKPAAKPAVAGKVKKVSASAHLVSFEGDRNQLPPHIKSMAIPPAWTHLRISMDPNADLLVTGKDAKGRNQPLYHADHRTAKIAKREAMIESFRKDKAIIAKQLEAGVKSTDPKTRTFADCASLIMRMGVRPGSDTDTQAKKKAYGATTIEGRHIVLENGQVHLRFDGKDGVFNDLPVVDKALAKNLAARKVKAGENGRVFDPVHEKSLLKFVHTLDHGGYKTKDLRTAIANEWATPIINSMPAPTDDKSYEKACRAVAAQVSSRLGNTPAICLKEYIVPSQFSTWRAGFVSVPKVPKEKKAKPAAAHDAGSESNEAPHAHFGTYAAPPIDWRKYQDEEPEGDQDDDRPADAGLIAMLGFDPDDGD